MSWEIPSRRRKTVTLTVRLDEQSEKELKEEAIGKSLSVNTLVSQIIAKYLEWDRHMEKLDAITIPADALARLSDRVDEESLADFARDLAKSRINLVRIWYKEVTPENVLRFLSFYFERNKTARIALSKDERPQHVIGFHRGGMKGSIWFKHFVEAMFKLSGKHIVVEVQENQFSFVFDGR